MHADKLLEAKILIVDDDAENIRLLEDILRYAGYTNFKSTTNPAAVEDIVANFHPDLVILDLVMPQCDGFEVMENINAIVMDQTYLPVLMVTGDYTPKVKQKALANGARDFLTRPFDVIEITLRIRNLLEARLFHLQLQVQNVLLEDRVRERTQELEAAQLKLKESQIEIILRLARAAELHDDDTAQHTERVALIASLIAMTMGLPDEKTELIRRAAPLHDVGKIGVSDNILLKPGLHTPDERSVMKTHCSIGAGVLSGGQSDILKLAETIAMTHHEHWDGTGYPDGLQGEEIPIEARILAVADVFDALTHERPYKQSWPVEKAVAEIRELSGTHFDPAVVDAFMTLPHEDLV